MRDGRMSEQSTEPNNSSNSHITNLYVAIIFGLGLLFSLWLLTQPTEIKLGLLAIIPLVLTLIYFMQPNSLQGKTWTEWLLDNSLTITAFITFWLLVAALILWLVVSFWWVPQYQTTNTQRVVVYQNVHVTLSHLGGALADGEPLALQVAISNQTAITQTIGLEATIEGDSYLLFTNPPVISNLLVAPGKQITHTFKSTVRQPAPAVRKPQTIVLKISNSSGGIKTNLMVEGVWSRRLRELVDNTVNKASALVILIAVLAPGLAKIANSYLAELKAKAAEAEKHLREKQRLEFERLFNEWRSSILADNLSQAKQFLEQIEGSDLRKINPQAIKLMRQLFNVAQPDENDNANEENAEENTKLAVAIRNAVIWPDVCVSVFLAVWQKCMDAKESSKQRIRRQLTLQQLRPQLPINQIDGYLADRVAQFEAHPDVISNVPQSWFPTPEPFPSTDLTVEGKKLFLALLVEKQARSDIDIEEADERPTLLQPFLHEQAERDASILFSTTTTKRARSAGPLREAGQRARPLLAFWPHTLYKDLESAAQSCLIFGVAGSGRTALALSLANHPKIEGSEKKILALYIKGQTDIKDIRLKFLRHILSFIRAHPACLCQLATGERDLLAELLVKSFGPGAAQAVVSRIQVSIESPDWEKERGDAETIENWRKVTRMQLYLLSQSLVKMIEIQGKRQANQNQKIWAMEIAACARSLGIDEVRLSIDAATKDCNWLKKIILPNLPFWQKDNFYVFVFLPDEAQNKIDPITVSAAYLNIEWQASDLVEMAKQRYSSVLDRSILNEFSSGAIISGDSQGGGNQAAQQLFAQFVLRCASSGQYTPRSFIKLWQATVLLLNPVSPKIEGEHISQLSTEDAVVVNADALVKQLAVTPEPSPIPLQIPDVKPLYEPQLNVIRTSLHVQMHRWLADESPETRVKSVVGAVGMGKSWFMRNLFLNLYENNDFLPIWLDMGDKPFYPNIGGEASESEQLSEQLYVSCQTDKGRRQWLEWVVKLVKGKSSNPIPYDSTIFFEYMFAALAQRLCRGNGPQPVLLVDNYDAVIEEGSRGFLLEHICAEFYGAGCTRIIITRRDDLRLPHNILASQEKIVHVPALDQDKRRQQMSRLMKAELEMEHPLFPHLSGNPFINAALHDRIANRDPMPPIKNDWEECLSQLLEQAVTPYPNKTAEKLLRLLRQLADLPSEWSGRDLFERKQLQIEDDHVTLLFQLGFIRQVRGRSYYQFEPELQFLLQKIQEE
jgi:hypothetical protein